MIEITPSRLIGIGLVLMSFSAGCVDILGYRFLGDVFTSAMTGNIALMGLDLGQGNLAAASRNMAAFAGFVAGLALGALSLRGGANRARLLRTALAEAALLLAFALAWHLREDGFRYPLIALAALAMGLQSAIAHRIGMGISTTYFTGTLTGIIFGLVGPIEAPLRRTARPIAAFLAYICGAATAGLLTPAQSAVLPALPCAATLALALLISLAHKS